MPTAHLCKLQAPKTYATRENAIKAVQKVYGPNSDHFGSSDTRYVVIQDDAGRWFPLFVGQSALQHGVHFNFNVVA